MKYPIPPGSTEVNIDVTFPSTEPAPNQIPEVNAGTDQTITLPTNSVTLNGKASDPDGTISLVVWENLDGNGLIENPTQLITKVNNLKKGTARFRLSVVDNLGAASLTDDTHVVINDVVTPPPTPGYQLVYENPFEKDSDIRNANTQQAGKGVISKTVFKEGAGSFYAIPETVSSGVRSEIQGFPTPTEGAMEWWVRYEVVVPDNMCSFQFHPNTPGSSGSPFLAHESGKFVWENWKMTSQGGANTPHPTGYTIPKNVWLKMRIEFKHASNGYFRHFINDVKVCEWTGQVGDGSGQYAKCGTNGWTNSAMNSRVYYDTLKVYKKV